MVEDSRGARTRDRIRVVSDTGQNLRIHPDTGKVAAVDGSLMYSATDVNAGATPRVAGAAYTNPIAGATTTTLYDIDTGLGVLATQSPPNSGTLNTVGSLGVTTNSTAGFDISQAGIGYAVLKVSGKPAKDRCGNSELFRVDLATGMVTSLGYVGSQQPVGDLAVFIPDPTP